MSDPSKASLSMLDLLTCGLGGVLLMFMVVLIMAQRLDLKETLTDQRAKGDPPKSPFVVLATANPPMKRGIDCDEPAVLWFEHDSSRWQDVQLAKGTDHAILYAPLQPPDGDIRDIRLRRKNVSTFVEVRVFHRGQQVGETKKISPGEDDPVTIPLYASGGE